MSNRLIQSGDYKEIFNNLSAETDHWKKDQGFVDCINKKTADTVISILNGFGYDTGVEKLDYQSDSSTENKYTVVYNISGTAEDISENIDSTYSFEQILEESTNESLEEDLDDGFYKSYEKLSDDEYYAIARKIVDLVHKKLPPPRYPTEKDLEDWE